MELLKKVIIVKIKQKIQAVCVITIKKISMKKILAIAFIALTLASCSTQYSCSAVDGGLASKCGGRR